MRAPRGFWFFGLDGAVQPIDAVAQSLRAAANPVDEEGFNRQVEAKPVGQSLAVALRVAEKNEAAKVIVGGRIAAEADVAFDREVLARNDFVAVRVYAHAVRSDRFRSRRSP